MTSEAHHQQQQQPLHLLHMRAARLMITCSRRHAPMQSSCALCPVRVCVRVCVCCCAVAWSKDVHAHRQRIQTCNIKQGVFVARSHAIHIHKHRQRRVNKSLIYAQSISQLELCARVGF